MRSASRLKPLPTLSVYRSAPSDSVLTQQQRAEMSSRPVGVAVAADRELPGQRTLDLFQPIAAARPAIRRVAQFGDHSFELNVPYRRVEILSARDHVIAIANRPLAVDQFA